MFSINDRVFLYKRIEELEESFSILKEMEE